MSLLVLFNISSKDSFFAEIFNLELIDLVIESLGITNGTSYALKNY